VMSSRPPYWYEEGMKVVVNEDCPRRIDGVGTVISCFEKQGYNFPLVKIQFPNGEETISAHYLREVQ